MRILLKVLWCIIIALNISILHNKLLMLIVSILLIYFGNKFIDWGINRNNNRNM